MEAQQRQLLDIVTEVVGLYSNPMFIGTIITGSAEDAADQEKKRKINDIITGELGDYEDILGIVEMLKQKIETEIKKPEIKEHLERLGVTTDNISEVLKFENIHGYIQGKKNVPEKHLLLQRMTDKLKIPGYDEYLNQVISEMIPQVKIPPVQRSGAVSLKKRRKRRKKSKKSKKSNRLKRVKRSKRSIKKCR